MHNGLQNYSERKLKHVPFLILYQLLFSLEDLVLPEFGRDKVVPALAAEALVPAAPFLSDFSLNLASMSSQPCDGLFFPFRCLLRASQSPHAGAGLDLTTVPRV